MSALHSGHYMCTCMYTDLKLAYIISFYINLNSIQVSITCIYMQGEKQKAQLVSVFGIIFGTLITAVVIAVGVLYFIGRIG